MTDPRDYSRPISLDPQVHEAGPIIVRLVKFMGMVMLKCRGQPNSAAISDVHRFWSAAGLEETVEEIG